MRQTMKRLCLLTVLMSLCASIYAHVFEGNGIIYKQVDSNTTLNKGDANSDGTVNAADIVEVVNYIMGKSSASFDEFAADVNGDDVINAADIVKIVNIIMSFDDNEDDDDSNGDIISEGDYLSIHLDRAGTLSSKISTSQASNLLKLKLSGHMDARDFDFIKWECMKVEEIDLADVVINSYYGREGTQEGENVSYAANEIPSGAFFYWKNVHKYVYDGMPIDEGMPSLKKIVLPQGITAIRRNAFARAYNLTEINIPEGVEAIDYVSFAICTSLEELYLPSTLKTVGQLAFADMKSIKEFSVAATTPPTAYSNSFQGIPSDAVLYVPSGTENQYRNAAGWNTFTNIVEIGDTPGDNTNDDEGDGDNDTISGDYLQVTLDGKSYSDKILDWYIAQIDPVGYDNNGKPLTLTYDMRDHFEDKGFSFFFGIVHFSRKSDLLASPVGSYGCAESILNDNYYNNLTFWSDLEIDYNEYKWISGTHNVKSIKEVNGDVQIEGSFTSIFNYEGDSKTVKGSYRITIP